MTVFCNCLQHFLLIVTASFLRRKIWHAYDNSADSENVVDAREPTVDVHFIFRFETVKEIRAFFCPWKKYS